MPMGDDLRFGVITLQNLPWEQEVSRWRRIEELGFDSVWLADHFVDYTRPREPWFECWTLLAALASQTRSIRVGTLVSNVLWRNPVFLARQALTLDHISGGRLELGLGAGAPADLDPSYEMTGIEDPGPRGRVERFGEVVEMVDRLLSNEATTYEGRYYRIKEAAMNPRPVQRPRPPITVGAQRPRMLRIAARHADAWNTFGGTDLSPEENLETVRRSNELLNRLCEEYGRDPGDLRRSLLLFGQEAWTLYDSSGNFEKVFHRYVDVGITEFILYYPFNVGQIAVFEKVAEEIIPGLRDN